MRTARIGSISVLAALALAIGGIGDARSDPATDLRLIVSSAPPSIVDVDQQTLQPVALPASDAGSPLWVSPVPNGAVAVILRGLSARAVLIRADGSTRALATGRSAIGVWNAGAAWVLARRTGGGCTLRRVPGRAAPVPAPCGFLEQDGAAGVVVETPSSELLVDHHTGRVRVRLTGYDSLLAPLHGELVFEDGSELLADGSRLALVDLRDGQRRSLRWPSTLGGIDGVVPEPHGPLVAVGFAEPGGDPQGEDLFLLDTRDGRFTHVPGYPIAEDLKRSSMAWTRDGRLVLTVHLGDTTTLGVYRPGDRTVAHDPLSLPAYAGSDTFVPVLASP